MITDADIRTAWIATFDMGPTAALSAVLTGGVWLGRVPELAGPPYGTLAVSEGDATYTSGAYLKPFTVEFAAYFRADDVNLTAFQTALTERFRPATAIAALTAALPAATQLAGQICGVRQLSGSATTLDPELRSGLDVAVVKAAWEVLASGA